jgi:hypothetical protein
VSPAERARLTPLRSSLVILQRNDHFLTGNYEDMEVHINFRNTVAVLKGLGVGAYTLSWVAPKHN